MSGLFASAVKSSPIWSSQVSILDINEVSSRRRLLGTSVRVSARQHRHIAGIADTDAGVRTCGGAGRILVKYWSNTGQTLAAPFTDTDAGVRAASSVSRLDTVRVTTCEPQ